MSYNFDAAVSPFIKALPASGLAKFLDIMASNPNIVPLSVGEPDFDIPQAVKDAEIVSMVTQGVTEEGRASFLQKLREAGSAEYKGIYQRVYDRRQGEK